MGGISAILFFGFGIAAGILIAFAGAGYIQDSAGTLVGVFFAALLAVFLLGLALFAARRRIWRGLFGYAEAKLEEFATPLARVAERAIDRDPGGATQAARDLVALVLARYAWITTRRWLVASLTALIAAMAALAGTALLFKQNQLLEVQSGLLEEQNARIADQSALLTQQVELAEAQRNATLAVEITDIAARLGDIATERKVEGGGEVMNYVNTLDVQKDVDSGLILRITSISRALKPYRFLDSGMRPGDPSDRFRYAMQDRRGDLPETYARLAAYNGWTDPPAQTRLIDRPASPERGQLLNVLVTGGIRNLEALNAAGLDLTHAWLPEIDLALFTGQMSRLAFADFTGAYLNDFDLGGSFAENVRFTRAKLKKGRFSTVDQARMRWPGVWTGEPLTTVLSGSDFSGAVVEDVDFSGAWMLATRFDGAVLRGADFTGAELGISTFRGALVLRADFTGAGLKSVDFEGAVVFGADALERLAASAMPDTFPPGRWELQPVMVEQILEVAAFANAVSEGDLAEAMATGDPFRIHRVGEPLK